MYKRTKRYIRYYLQISLLGFVMLIGATELLFSAPVSTINAPAPLFSSETIDGKTIGTAKLSGKAYIVNFFASWCPPCRAEIPDMVSLQSQYSRKGFTFIGVAVNETVPKIKSFVAKNRISYPVVMADDKIVSAFSQFVDGGLQSIPTSFVVNSSGRVIQVIVGGKNKAEFEQTIIVALKKTGKNNK
ncbi:MAG: TlpA disulfide reductase family protein [Chlorobiaceae bacterium]